MYPGGPLVGLKLIQQVISLNNFPFTAVTGQASFKLALCLAAINPAIGGVLVSGPRGSAKSTLARGLADIMVDTNNDKVNFITLPLGATEEMLLGTLNLEQVLASKKTEFQPVYYPKPIMVFCTSMK